MLPSPSALSCQIVSKRCVVSPLAYHSLMCIIDEPWLCTFCCPAGCAVTMCQFAACIESSMRHGIARSAVLQDLLLLWVVAFVCIIEPWLCTFCCPAGFAVSMISLLEPSLSVCGLPRDINEPLPCTSCCPAGSAVAMDFCAMAALHQCAIALHALLPCRMCCCVVLVDNDAVWVC